MAALGCGIEVVLSPDDRQADAVRTLSGPVEFEYCVARRGQYELYCEVFGHAFPSKWYVVPSRDGLVPPAERYDLGLDKVVQYARGASSAESIARRLNAGIAEELCYNPEYRYYTHALALYGFSSGVDCVNHSQLLEYLCETAGIPASMFFTWAGQGPGIRDVYQMEVGDVDVTFQLDAPANDTTGADPHFGCHALTTAAGIPCDPSYGSTWVPPAIEMYEGCSQRSGDTVPSIPIVHLWRCPHAPGELGPCP